MALDSAGLDFHIEDILDVLWLAAQERTLSVHAPHIALTPGEVPSPGPARRGSVDQPPVPPLLKSPPDRPVVRPIDPPPAPVYPGGKLSPGEQAVRATPVTVPSGRALPGRLALMRALRPFRQRWRSRRDEELDEERTAEATADLNYYLYPIFRPVQKRWFDVEVVLEDDAAIGLWAGAIRDFCQVLRDAGAFRDVRSWRLRLPPAAAAGKVGGRATLETPAGCRVSTGVLAGRGTRRLVFFATHGSSCHWLDGTYARILEPWAHSSSVVLLHLLPRDRWKRTQLGDAHGFCYTQEPGVTSSALRINRFWWSLGFDDEDHSLLPIPAIPLKAAAVTEWARMQMARGRRCPVFLLDPAQAPTEEIPSSPLITTDDFEVAVAALREASPEAFRLAVYLCSSAFTLPVARLVQEAKFGATADQSYLADVLLSGLVFARSPQDANPDPDMLYYDFRPEARTILMRSLREADAESIAEALQQRVSQYIQQIYGRAITFRALVPDESGSYELPAWAQPFAQVGISLLGIPDYRENALELFKQFCASNPKNILGAATRLAVSTSGNSLNYDSAKPEVWRALLDSRLIRQNSAGQWVFLPGIEAQFISFEAQSPFVGVKLLWVDDFPSNNSAHKSALEAEGAQLALALSTDEAMRQLRSESYDGIISDLGRGEDEFAGFSLLDQVMKLHEPPPVAIYAGSRALRYRREALERGAVVSTNDFAEVRKVFLRAFPEIAAGAHKYLSLGQAWRFTEQLQRLGLPESVALAICSDPQSVEWEDVWSTAEQRQGHSALPETFLRIIDQTFLTGYNQLFVFQDRRLLIASQVISEDKATYEEASLDGIIGRAVRGKTTVYAADVRREPDYILAERTTIAELAIPIIRSGAEFVSGVINIESSRGDPFSAQQIEWLEAAAGSFAVRWQADHVTVAKLDEASELPRWVKAAVAVRAIKRLLPILSLSGDLRVVMSSAKTLVDYATACARQGTPNPTNFLRANTATIDVPETLLSEFKRSREDENTPPKFIARAITELMASVRNRFDEARGPVETIFECCRAAAEAAAESGLVSRSAPQFFHQLLAEDLRSARNYIRNRSSQSEDPCNPEDLGPLWSAVSVKQFWAFPPSSPPAKPKHWVLVAGLGVPPFSEELREICKLLGEVIFEAGCGLISGGWPGVDEYVAEAFVGACNFSGSTPTGRLVQVTEPGFDRGQSSGEIISTRSSEEAVEHSVSLANALVLISGAGGTYWVAKKAENRGVPVLPINATGGDAATYYSQRLERWDTAAIRGLRKDEFTLLSEDPILATGLLPRLFSKTFAPVSTDKVPERLHLLRKLSGHKDVVLRITWRGDGAELATTSVDKTIRIWNATDGSELKVLTGHFQGVNCAVWSPDRRLLASCSYDRTIRVWSTETWRCTQILEDHKDDVPGISWSPDGRYLASCSADERILIWDTTVWKPIRSFLGHKSVVCRVIWSPDGRLLYSCSADFTIRVWELATGKLRSTLKQGTSLIDIACSPDGRTLAAGSFSANVFVWSLDTKKHRVIKVSRSPVRGVSFSADGRFIAVNAGLNGKGVVQIWETENWEKVWEMTTDPSEFWPCNLAWSPSFPILATLAEQDLRVCLWQGNFSSTSPFGRRSPLPSK
jgi:WD40 repeat protein/CheY-like chemotaxis protein